MANEPVKQPKKKSMLARMTSFSGSKKATRTSTEENKPQVNLAVPATPTVTEAEAQAIGKEFAQRAIADAEATIAAEDAAAAAAAEEEAAKEAEAAKLKEWQEAELARKNRLSGMLPAALLVGLVALAVYAAMEMQAQTDAAIVPAPVPKGPFAALFGNK